MEPAPIALEPAAKTLTTTQKAKRIGMEAAVAVTAAGFVSPFITIIDKSIIANASGRQKLLDGLKTGFTTLFTRPGYFAKQPAFLLIWGVYSGTYIVANSIEAICEFNDVPWFYPKFIGTSITNVTLSVIKDKILTRMFAVVPPKPLPLLSYGCFTARDSLSILASFNLPDPISKKMQENFGIDKHVADITAQLVTPCAAQALSSPLHLVGLDLYNNPARTVPERMAFVKQEYVGTTLARMGRIFPAYGIGGVVNKFLRKKGKELIGDETGGKHVDHH
eukprot:TRINITY_DN1202_c0_g1_i1.p1 TRINITY_DN1202_c0_g1~~TRINITY_DN1202_c0_g1_i1.p1  ORF type:complete len:278 (-),score=67.89 TRINITY_DN1202_c0_g1_i1:89-922(-)